MYPSIKKEVSIMAEEKIGCARPTGNVVAEPSAKEDINPTQTRKENNNMITAKVGSKAPDFEAPAYNKGKFISVKLSDYQGRWVIVCFYPGDFTFV